MTRFIDIDPASKSSTVFHEDQDEFVIETVQDVQPVADEARRSFNQYDTRAPWKGDMHRVASIPLTIWVELQRTGVADDPVALKRWINDPVNSVFRTRPGRV